jgi:hypothetical protein
MKMGNIVSPWRYDAAARHALQPARARQPANLRFRTTLHRRQSSDVESVRLPLGSRRVDPSWGSTRWAGSGGHDAIAQFEDHRMAGWSGRATREDWHDLSLWSRPPLAHRSRDLASTLNESLHHRAQGSILQRHGVDRPWPDRQIYRQHFERLEVRH